MEILQLVRKNPFLRIVLPYLAGLATGYFYFPAEILWITLVLALVPAVLLLLVQFLRPVPYGYEWIPGLLIHIIFFSAGALHVQLRGHLKTGFQPDLANPSLVRMLITDSPEVKPRTIHTAALVYPVNDPVQTRSGRVKVMLILERDSLGETLKAGDIIIAETRYEFIPGPANPGEFNYRDFLSRQDIDYQLYVSADNWSILDRNLITLKILALLCRDRLLRAFHHPLFDRRVTSVLSALTLGYKNDLEADTRAAFTRAGVVHVMALSGFNVGILYLMVNFLLGFLPGKRLTGLIRLVLSLVFIWCFVIITGLSPSVTRAGVMISLLLTGKQINRDASSLNIICASAFLILLVSPLQFLDVGFQLSFAAVLGIVYLQPWLYRLWIPGNIILDKIWILFTVSVAAQMATSPLTLHYFHQFPVFFWITNLYVVPLVTLIIYEAGAYLLLSFIAPVKLAMAHVLDFTVKALLWPLDQLKDFPGAVADGIYVNGFQAGILILILILVLLFLSYRNLAFIKYALTMILVFMAINTLWLWKTSRQHSIIVPKIRNSGILNIISGRKSLVIHYAGLPPDDRAISYALKNNWIREGVFHQTEWIQNFRAGDVSAIGNRSELFHVSLIGENALVLYAGVSLLIATHDLFEAFESSQKLAVDYIVVSKNIHPDIEKVVKHFQIGCIILDSSLSLAESRKWIKMCASHGISAWCVNNEGAFVLSLN
jgi:competence protein ComEC